MPIKVTIYAYKGFLVMCPHEPEKGIGNFWAPTSDSRMGCVIGDTKKRLACSREALDLMKGVRRNGDAIGDLGWWWCQGGTYAFSWFGPIFRILDPDAVEGDREFSVHEDQCTIVPNEIPADMLKRVKAAIAKKKDLWQEPWSITAEMLAAAAKETAKTKAKKATKTKATTKKAAKKTTKAKRA